MSFFAENNRIRITNSGGATIFDTDTPMPHIIQELSKSVTHTFPDVPHGEGGFFNQFSSNICTQVITRYECRTDVECNFDPDTGFSCEPVEVCDFVDYIEPIPFGTYEWIITADVTATESQSTYKIGDISNSIGADFIVVTMNGSRTSGGSHFEYGTFVSALPGSKDIAGNGSAILESSFLAGGQSWLRRIVSVYVSGAAVYAQFKHSNRSRSDLYSTSNGPVCFPGQQAPPNYNTSSSFTISFNVQVGKFTQ